MDTVSIVLGVCGLFLTVINILVVIILGFILSSIRRLEDRHIAAVKELHEKIDRVEHDAIGKREKDLTEMRDRLGDIDLKLVSIEGELKAA